MANFIHTLVITHPASPAYITAAIIKKSGRDAAILLPFKLKKG